MQDPALRWITLDPSLTLGSVLAVIARLLRQHALVTGGHLRQGSYCSGEPTGTASGRRCSSAGRTNGGLTDAELADALRDRSGVPVTSTLLRRLRDTVRSYSMRRVDLDLFRSARLGAKIVFVFRGNPARGLPTVTSIHVLSDIVTGSPQAIMDGTYLTASRTAPGRPWRHGTSRAGDAAENPR